MKKVLIVIFLWFIVAAFFYAAIWTNENNTLSNCFLFTGIVAIGQVILTWVCYPFMEDDV